jgi:hypothetical protein
MGSSLAVANAQGRREQKASVMEFQAPGRLPQSVKHQAPGFEGIFWFFEPHSNVEVAGNEQNDDDHQEKAYNAARPVSPVLRVTPCRQPADEKQNQNDE